MPSYHYGKSHYKDAGVLRPSYLYNDNTQTDGLYIETYNFTEQYMQSRNRAPKFISEI